MDKKTKLLLLAVLAFGLIIRLIFFNGMGTSDDLWYSQIANRFSNGDFTIEPNQINSRIGLLLPVSFFYSIFGVNDFSSIFFSLLVSLAGIVLIFFFGKLLFNEKTGLVAAFLISFFPLDVLYSTRLLSDLPSAFFAALSVFLFLKAEKNGKKNIHWLYSG